MDLNDDEIIEVPVLRLYPLENSNDGEDSRYSLKRTDSGSSGNTKFRRSESFLSSRSSLGPSQSPDRLVFPGHQRPKSAACILRELQTPTKGRNRNSIRQNPEAEEVRHLPDAPKKVSHDELDLIVTRLQRQTNCGRARTALTRRISFAKREESNTVKINYLCFDPCRFKGLRKVTKSEMDNIVNRLSSYQKDRQPAESERHQLSRENHEKLGVLNSYRWKGIRNC